MRNDQKAFRVEKVGVRRLLAAILGELSDVEIPESVHELSVLFIDNATMRELNSQYRGKNKATDVLSFSQLEGEGLEAVTLLGDVVISIEYAAAEARKRGITLQAEMLRLLIHGLLHLFGYDHEAVPAAVRARMKRREEKLMVTMCEYAADTLFTPHR